MAKNESKHDGQIAELEHGLVTARKSNPMCDCSTTASTEKRSTLWSRAPRTRSPPSDIDKIKRQLRTVRNTSFWNSVLAHSSLIKKPTPASLQTDAVGENLCAAREKLRAEWNREKIKRSESANPESCKDWNRPEQQNRVEVTMHRWWALKGHLEHI